jgi:hypothetical protein
MTIQSRDRSAYISDLSFELAEMARQDGHDVLAYLLAMAGVEAKQLCGGKPFPTIPRSQTVRSNGVGA